MDKVSAVHLSDILLAGDSPIAVHGISRLYTLHWLLALLLVLHTTNTNHSEVEVCYYIIRIMNRWTTS